MLIRLNRDFGTRTTVEEPTDNDVAWPDMKVVGVLAHSGGMGELGGGGHWCAYIRRNQVWWCVDTQTDVIVNINPFTQQQDHTVDMIVLTK